MRHSWAIGCVAILTALFSACNLHEEKTIPRPIGPKVVEAHGYVVPTDSLPKPKILLVNESMYEKVLAGKPKAISTNTNVHLAGKPKVVMSGTPRVCIPGQDTFLLPKSILAIDSPFLAGVPVIVIAKDARSKDQNSQNFSSFNKLQGLKHAFISAVLEDHMGNLWFGSSGGGVSKYDGKSFTHYTEQEGLSNNNISGMIEDHKGNLWFATSDGGINKFDGTSFTHYTEKEGLSSNICTSIFEDHLGTLWIGTFGGGLNQFDGKKFTHFSVKEGLSNNDVTTIFEDHAGNLWFGNSAFVVSKYDGNRVDAIERGENIPLSEQQDLKKQNGKLVKSFTHFKIGEGLSSGEILSIIEDQDENLWIGTNGGGVVKYDGKSFSFFTEKEGLSNNSINQILEDKDRNFWFSTNGGGICKYDGRTFTHFTENEGLPFNTVYAMVEDKAGNLWCGTWGGGICKYGGKTFTHFTEKEGLGKNVVTSMVEDRKGNLWFGTDGGGISKYATALNGQEASFTNFTKKEGLSDIFFWSIMKDHEENLWFGTNANGVVKYDGNSFINYTVPEVFSHFSTTAIVERANGNIWFSTNGGGVIKYDGKNFTHFTTKEGLSNDYVTCMLEDQNGNLWFGTYGGGVTKYDGTSFTWFTEKGGLSKNYIRTMMKDKSGNLWIGTDGGGVNKYTPPRDNLPASFTWLTEKEGLSNNAVLSILEDKNDNFWFGTRLGISKLPSKKLAEMLALNIREVSDKNSSNSFNGPDVFFQNYSYENGFLGVGCTVNSILEDSHGNIWIGANDKLTVYHPEGDNENTQPPNIQVTGIELFNEKIAWANLAVQQASSNGLEKHQIAKDTSITLGNGVSVNHFRFDGISKWYGLPEHLSLAPNNNHISFNFIGITLTLPTKVKYQYKLEGNDENWSAFSTRSEAPYGNLPHGAYTFKVKAMDSAGNLSEEFHYPFTIRPPWWLTWWAYSLYGLGLIFVFWRVHLFQRARTIRLEREKTQQRELAQAKEIEKAYSQLETAHENLKATQKQLIQSEKMASLGELTAGIAHEIQNPLNFVNNFSEVNKELLMEMKVEIESGNLPEVKSIANDVIANEEKINHHGKRADAIVKGMLQHSRASSGIKEPTDINALAEEYLRLAYHGLRAKDKTFNATMKTDFDHSIGMINIVPQDIGRVILNLITNAFYAVSNMPPQPPKGGEIFSPTVTISTKKYLPPRLLSGAEVLGGQGGKTGSMVQISVSDNGPGIPASALDKIFQPFFTTKPTGQGTGLGLSLSYDIVKAHGGELKVETKEGEGTVFTIQLPIR